MDAVFGADLFLNEMTWKRSSAHSDTRQGMRRAGKIRDVLLGLHQDRRLRVDPAVYALHRGLPGNGVPARRPGRSPLQGNRRHSGQTWGRDTEYQWHVKRPAGEKVRSSADLTDEHLDPQPGWEYKAVTPYRGRYWAYSKPNLSTCSNEGRLVHGKTGMPRLMQFSEDMPGVPLQDLWDDIPPVLGNERIGYPTQKPLALLERIIKASSNEGDVVLDPFCGCATACVAADNLGRRWLGIDISPKAVELVNLRLRQSMGELFHNRLVTARTDIPRRTDIDAPVPYRQNKHVLFGQQEGRCGGVPFALRVPPPGG